MGSLLPFQPKSGIRPYSNRPQDKGNRYRRMWSVLPRHVNGLLSCKPYCHLIETFTVPHWSRLMTIVQYLEVMQRTWKVNGILHYHRLQTATRFFSCRNTSTASYLVVFLSLNTLAKSIVLDLKALVIVQRANMNQINKVIHIHGFWAALINIFDVSMVLIGCKNLTGLLLGELENLKLEIFIPSNSWNNW